MITIGPQSMAPLAFRFFKIRRRRSGPVRKQLVRRTEQRPDAGVTGAGKRIAEHQCQMVAKYLLVRTLLSGD